MLQAFSCNLSTRTDRKLHIENEFCCRSELKLNVLSPILHNVGSMSLWLTLQYVVKEKVNWEDEFFIFCEDDHQFTENYNFDLLQKYIQEAQTLDADILSGGV